MPNALTPLQFEVMRRVRDGNPWSSAERLKLELREAVFLRQLGLLVCVELGKFDLSEVGRQYLDAHEASRSAD